MQVDLSFPDVILLLFVGFGIPAEIVTSVDKLKNSANMCLLRK